jgi:hypothetical protein
MIHLHPVCQETEGGARANDAPVLQAPSHPISDDMPLRAKERRLCSALPSGQVNLAHRG